MNRMKKQAGLLAMMASMASMYGSGYHEGTEYQGLTDKKKEELKSFSEKKRIERLKKQGVNEYFYGQNVIYARNQKNADRKARNKGYI